MQKFKGDEFEEQMIRVGQDPLDQCSFQKNLFSAGAYEAYPLGDVLYDSKRAPLTNAIVKNIFRESFKEIFDCFIESGNFESYLTVFRKIFGNDVEVEFTIPSPGHLQIDIVAAGLEISDFVARYIEENEYLFDEIIDQEGDNIAFQTVKGFESEYELEQMLFELVPAGIHTEITLTVGA